MSTSVKSRSFRTRVVTLVGVGPTGRFGHVTTRHGVVTVGSFPSATYYGFVSRGRVWSRVDGHPARSLSNQAIGRIAARFAGQVARKPRGAR